jgi:hypothetical protein
MEVEMSDRIPFPPGPRRLSGGGVAFDVFVRPSGFVVVDEAQIRAIQRRCRYRRISRGAAWVGRRIATRRAALLMAALALASVALWPATLGFGSPSDSMMRSFAKRHLGNGLPPTPRRGV